MIALLDADIFVYRVGAVSNDDTVHHAQQKMDAFIEGLLIELDDCFEWELYITGTNNFRKEKAVTAPYKGNRKSEKPAHYEALRKHLQKKWKAELIDDKEADDMLAIRQIELTKDYKELDNSIIVTLDKDLDQIEGWHYNFVKKDKYLVEHEEALLNFYKQFLTGDRVDNIIGVKGIGDVKATKLLEGKTEKEMWDIVVEHLGLDRAIENGHLLYMLRHKVDSFDNYVKTMELLHG
jgi:hypothetical protein